jgi:hypothetical protein
MNCRPRFLIPTLLAFVLGGAAAFAAPVEKDAGDGLKYLRTTDVKADSSAITAALSQAALILDLRNADTDEIAAEALSAALDRPVGRAHVVRLILINGTTSPLLISAVGAAHPGVITVGPATPSVTPDVKVAISREDDRRAYEAFNTGTPWEKLISTAPEKSRFDEAALARDHSGANRGSDTAPDAPEAPSSTATKEPPAATGPIDLVLQRAIQIHRALRALKKV